MGVLYLGRYSQRDISLFHQRKVGLAHLGVGLATDREDTSRRPPPVSLRLPSGSSSDPQTGAPESARLGRLLPAPACVCVPLDAAVTHCNGISLDI